MSEETNQPGNIDFNAPHSSETDQLTGDFVPREFSPRFIKAVSSTDPDSLDAIDIAPSEIDFSKPILLHLPGFLIYDGNDRESVDLIKSSLRLSVDRSTTTNLEEVQVLTVPYPHHEEDKELFEISLTGIPRENGLIFSEYSEKIAKILIYGVLQGKDIPDEADPKRADFLRQAAKIMNNITVDGYSVGSVQSHYLNMAMMDELMKRNLKKEEVSYLMEHCAMDCLGDMAALSKAGVTPFPGGKIDSYLAYEDGYHLQKLERKVGPTGNDQQIYDISPQYVVAASDMPDKDKIKIANIPLDKQGRVNLVIADMPKEKWMVSEMTIEEYREHLIILNNRILGDSPFAENLDDRIQRIRDAAPQDLSNYDPNDFSHVIQINVEKGIVHKVGPREDPNSHGVQTYGRRAVPVDLDVEHTGTIFQAQLGDSELLPLIAQKSLTGKVQASAKGQDRSKMNFVTGRDPDGVLGLKATDATTRIKKATVRQADLEKIGSGGDDISDRIRGAGRLLGIRVGLRQERKQVELNKENELPVPHYPTDRRGR